MLNLKRWEEALPRFKEVIPLRSHFNSWVGIESAWASLWVIQAMIHRSKNQHAEAVAEFEAALSLRPDHFDTRGSHLWATYGAEMAAIGRLSDAVGAYEKFINIDTPTLDDYVAYFRLLLTIDNKQASLEALDRVFRQLVDSEAITETHDYEESGSVTEIGQRYEGTPEDRQPFNSQCIKRRQCCIRP